MATTLKFIGSKVSPSDETGVIMLNVLFHDGKDTIMVSLPHLSWANTKALFNDKEVDFAGEYDNRVNKAVKQANKLFPNWSI